MVLRAGGGGRGSKGSIEAKAAKGGETKEVGLGIAGYGRDAVLRFMQEKRERGRKEERAERKAKEEEEQKKNEEMAKVVGHYRALSMDVSRRGRERERQTFEVTEVIPTCSPHRQKRFLGFWSRPTVTFMHKHKIPSHASTAHVLP